MQPRLAQIRKQREMNTEEVVVERRGDQVEEADLVAHLDRAARVLELRDGEARLAQQRRELYPRAPRARVGEPGHDALRVRHPVRRLALRRCFASPVSAASTPAWRARTSVRPKIARRCPRVVPISRAAHPGCGTDRMGATDMAAEDDVIAVVDDSEIVRDALDELLVSVGYRTELYASAEEFMRAATTTRAACLVVDVELGAHFGTAAPARPVGARPGFSRDPDERIQRRRDPARRQGARLPERSCPSRLRRTTCWRCSRGRSRSAATEAAAREDPTRPQLRCAPPSPFAGRDVTAPAIARAAASGAARSPARSPPPRPGRGNAPPSRNP